MKATCLPLGVGLVSIMVPAAEVKLAGLIDLAAKVRVGLIGDILTYNCWSIMMSP